jgi:succinyl-CoA synthetase alpha subunit/GNAT superfamily N-acetyltransferase
MIDTAPPADWDIVLRDGSTLHVRAYEQADADRVRQFLRGLSDESIYLRFFGFLPVERFRLESLDSSEPGRRYTLLAESGSSVLALATYVRATKVKPEAEAAFVIADRMQGQGIGTRLLELLADVARAHDITTFTACVLGRNARMMDVFRQSGFPMECRVDHGDYAVTIDLVEARSHDQRAYERTRQAAAASMRRLFEPASVAVVGAGRERGGIGAEIFHNLQATFTGTVIPVNAHATHVGGIAAYGSIRQVPDPVDLAVVAVPCAQVPAVVDDCLAKGVHGLVVISAGFAESGTDGLRLQDQVLARVREAGIRLVGPNCLGILNTDPLVRLNATFSPADPPAGCVAMSTQSGALGLAILDYARELNIGISSFASIGNKADVSSNDLIQYWAEDRRTRVILLYLESFGNARTFGRLARHVGRAKPIVAIKAGRSSAGARAAASHTGALAASDLLADGLFRQAGIVRVDTLEEMFDVATLLAHQPLPAGPRLGILTNAGGAGILAADAAESSGLVVPALSTRTTTELCGLLAATASVANPVDMLASASAAQYERALTILLADPGIDSVLVL